MRSFPSAGSSCHLTLMSREREQEGGEKEVPFEGAFRFKGCRSGSCSGLPMTKVTGEDKNTVCVCVVVTRRIAGMIE